MSQKIKLLITYDGTDFGGWQRQKSGKPTIQGEIESALARIFNQKVNLVGSGRTDAGVHALGQIAHFRAPKDIHKYNLVRALNSLTNEGIVIQSAWIAPDDFHAIASSQRKTYKYLILNNPTPSALRHRYTTWVRQPLNLEYLNQVSQLLLGEHDFKSFQTRGTEVPNTIRQIEHIQWRQKELHLVEFTITGDGFLKQMVRNIIGCQLDMFLAQSQATKIIEILDAKDRQKALSTAPPQGLYLYSVEYPHELDNKCRKI